MKRLQQQQGDNRKRNKTENSSSGAGPSSSNMDTVCGFLRGMTPSGHFTNARDVICQNFEELLEQVIRPCYQVSENTLNLPRETTQDADLKILQTQIEECQQKVLDIVPILQRNYMKAVVFGCTSSGKSTLVNAMLEDDVLPTSMGVCSSCLVQIVGCEEQEPYLMLPDGSHRNVEDLEKIGNELEDTHLGAGDTVIVHWPKTKLLNNDIQIVDRPGISSNPEIDQIVNDKCADADVHIFVVDSIASITTESRGYFTSVAKKLSKPNIFFVYNKWDESAYQKPERNQKVRQQHVKAAKDLMKDGLNAELHEEFDRNKIFFVSAREILWARTNDGHLLNGHEERREEFDRFLTELQTSISTHAIKTKFGPHCCEGIYMCDRLDRVAQSILDCLDHAMNELQEIHSNLMEEVNLLRVKQDRFGESCEDMTEEAKTRLQRRVTEKKDGLRRRLDRTLEEIPFEEDEIGIYKETVLDRFRASDDDLHMSIEDAVTDDLADIRRDMEDLADTGNTLEDTRIPNTTRFRLRRPQTSLSDAAAKDLHSNPPSYTQSMAWFRRGMSSIKAKLTTLAGSAIGAGAGAAAGSTGVGAGIILIGGSALGLSTYLERERQLRKQEILESIMANYRTWLIDQEHIAQVTCLTQAGELANNIRSKFNDTINRKVEDNRNLIIRIDACIQQLKVASECLKIYKRSQLQKVKRCFEEFQWNYLQDRDNQEDNNDWQFL